MTSPSGSSRTPASSAASSRWTSLLLLAFAGCAAPPEGRFGGLGTLHRPVTTASAEAQAWFDQGLAFLYAFNHDEAVRSFSRVWQEDPRCAMGFWGVALACGPHINNPALDDARARLADRYASIAKSLSAYASPVERDLIDALAKRYADPPPEDRGPLDQAYADAMRAAWKKHPKDPDVGALCAEALMDLHPWDLWLPDGKPRPWTGEIVHVLEETLALDPDHPLALHLYIHAVEASPEPGKADAPADRLRELQPGLGHLVHMPSHIDVRRGRWVEAMAANRKAVAADAAYVLRAQPPGFYRLYIAHNRHMLAFAAMMKGESRVALGSVRAMLAEIPEAWLRENAGLVDGFLAAPLEVLLRFGRWEEVLAEPAPAATFPLARALRHFCRAVALAALGRPTEARDEQKRFRDGAARVPKDAAFGNNAAAALLGVAERMLEGELLYREGKADAAFAALREGVAREDALRYDEPPDWIQPVRHSLGAALLKSGRAAEAEAVYLEDLRRWPENGWSLFGLAKALRVQGKDAAGAEARFSTAWAGADVALSSSCLCFPGDK